MSTARELLTAAGLAESVWGRRIIEAEGFFEFEIEDGDDAGEWVTCACGQLDPGIPRETDGAPRDRELRRLGRAFYGAVTRDEIVESARLLIRIERRAAELLAEVPDA